MQKGFYLKEIASIIDAELLGENVHINGIANFKEAQDGQITWAENPRILAEAEKGGASAVIVPRNVESSSKNLLKVAEPRFGFAKVLELFAPKRIFPSQIHETASIDENVTFGKNCYVGANSVLESGVVIGSDVVIYPLAYIGCSVEIGDGTIIYPNVTVNNGTKIGSNCIIHSGTVIGGDGFGYVNKGEDIIKIQQIGTVEIGNNVEIGSNVTIDRATTGKTMVGDNTKIDNLVQVGHNVKIGKGVIIAAQSGIAGSSVIGDHTIIASQSGVSDHITIGDECLLYARSGVIKDLAAKSKVSGFPAIEHISNLRIKAVMLELPVILSQFKDAVKRVEKLEEKIGNK